MKSPQCSTVMVWLLAGVVAANVAAAEPGRGDDRRAAHGPWVNKLDRALQRATDGASREGNGRHRVIIRARAGVDLRGSDAFNQLVEKGRAHGAFALELVGGVVAGGEDQNLQEVGN